MSKAGSAIRLFCINILVKNIVEHGDGCKKNADDGAIWERNIYFMMGNIKKETKKSEKFK